VGRLGAAFFSHVADSCERCEVFARDAFDRQAAPSCLAAQAGGGHAAAWEGDACCDVKSERCIRTDVIGYFSAIGTARHRLGRSLAAEQASRV
jgi:hypothetical protein